MSYVKIIEEKYRIGFIEKSDYPIVEIEGPHSMAKIIEVLPFRIKFTNIGIPSYFPPDVPPIGIAIVGFNNYIL